MTIGAYESGVVATNQPTINVTLPAHSEGDLLIVAVAQDAPSVGNIATFSASGWTFLYNNVNVTNRAALAVAVKTAGASESSPVTFTSDKTERSTWVAWSMSSHNGIDAQAATPTAANGSAVTFPAVVTTKPGTMVFALIATDEQSLPHGVPTNYTALTDVEYASATTLSVAYRTLSGAGSETPGGVSITAEEWAAVTFAVAPEDTTALTLADLTIVATGMLSQEGAAALTLSALTLSATGFVATIDDGVVGLAPLALSAAGAVAIDAPDGATALALDGLTFVATGATGALPLEAAASIDLDNVTLDAAASAITSAGGAVVLADLTLVASGTIADTTAQGEASIALDTLALSATGDALIRDTSGAASIALDSVTLVIASVSPISGAGVLVLDSLLIDALALPLRTGAVDSTLGDLALVAIGTNMLPAINQVEIVLDGLAIDGAGTVAMTGSANITLGDLTLDSAGSAPGTGEGAASITLHDCGMTIIGTIQFVNQTIDRLTVPAARGRRMSLAASVQGAKYPSKVLVFVDDNGQRVPLPEGTTITGIIDPLTDEARAVAGTLTRLAPETLVAGVPVGEGAVLWELDATDVAEAGTFEVQFSAELPSGPTPMVNKIELWTVHPALGLPG